MPRPVRFEIHCEDLDRAQAFYEAMFDWRFRTFPGVDYRLVLTGSGPGIDGGLVRRSGALDQAAPTPVVAWVCTVNVDDLDEYIERAEANGAAVALPKQVLPGVGAYAYYKDSEGNIFGMIEPEARIGG